MIIVAAAFVATIWLMTAEPPEIARSRALRLGMTKQEAEQVMGFTQTVGYKKANGEEGIMYGTTGRWWVNLQFKINQWTGMTAPGLRLDAWPVRCRFDENGRIDRIERGSEIEE
ncbi:MAG TPA: hypothetical protein VM510_07985 [Caulifigura sp.]|nr:hypothetical protein [Caulifigura sp.]